ncbi:glutathione S-transferase family protein [Marinobacter fonticola]|uniref:glutathione S-transferase family protein n=1 Tax=Marinobacter fonticola TaxID=2603215 RepID=UPI0011E777CB|nr:glutathione S-transferase family protein [Marinobacter fonticola]
MQLVIGNKNYSSWSLRPWLLMSASGLAFEEIQESLHKDDITRRLGQYSPTCRVPVLIDDGVTVWDSLAICEYVSETYLDGQGWPSDRWARAQARAVCTEMHSGFSALRKEMPMNCRARRRIELSDAAKADIARIDAIWTEYSSRYSEHGPWLFGSFSIADCFFAPVAFRFLTYDVELSDSARQYAERLRDHGSMQHWLSAARDEKEVVAEDEVGVEA